MTVTIIATRGGEQFLLDSGKGKGRVYDVSHDEMFAEFAVGEITRRGHWSPTTTDLAPPIVVRRIEELLAPLGETVTAAAVAIEDKAKSADDGPGSFTLTLLDEAEPTIDGRYFASDSVTWREPPVPLMFMTVKSAEGHTGSRLGGVIKEIWRAGSKILGKGNFESGENGQELRRLIDEQALTGVSSDVGGAIQTEELGEDGVKKTHISQGRIMGATVLPFPAFDETRIAITAAAVLERAPAAWFKFPNLRQPTPLTITSDGQIFGHAALWGTCHIGHQGRCLEPPKNTSGYQYFRTGSVLTAEGETIPVGPITLGTGHAGIALGASATAAHYDNTGTAAADVATGEDEFGIWFAGALRPGISDERIHELQASALSGDWRTIKGGLELVALLAVNTPGFPVPRTTVALAGEEPLALVAAGMLVHGEEDPEVIAASADCGCGSHDGEPCGCETKTELSEEDAELLPRLGALEDAVVALATRFTKRQARTMGGSTVSDATETETEAAATDTVELSTDERLDRLELAVTSLMQALLSKRGLEAPEIDGSVLLGNPPPWMKKKNDDAAAAKDGKPDGDAEDKADGGADESEEDANGKKKKKAAA